MRKSPGKLSSNTSSNIISVLHAKAFELLKSDSKETSAGRVGNNWQLKKASPTRSPLVVARQSKDFYTTRTIESIGAESQCESKNTITEVSKKMLVKHLKTPLNREDIFNKVTQAEM
jgi:hypothetical protein